MRSYRTISPLPFAKLRAVCFLWHFPWDCSRSLLGTTMPCGARTFLPPACNPVIRGAVAWPPFALRKADVSRVLSRTTICLGFALPRTSNGLPGSYSETGRLILPYLAFLRAGFTMPLLSPGTR